MNTKALIDHLVRWLKKYAEQEKRNGFVVGVSGGLDSAVVSKLCALTTLPTLAIFLPIHQARDERLRARAHLRSLGRQHPNVAGTTLELDRTFNVLRDALATVDSTGDLDMALANLRSRIRLNVLYYFAALHARVVVGTSNRTEHAVGFFAKYGDSAMDLDPIGALTKSEVYELAAALRIDARIRKADPTDGLWPDGRTDRDQLRASYAELDWALEIREGGRDTSGMALDQRQLEVLTIFDERQADNEHKLRSAPICPIPFSLRIPPAKPAPK